ncbi:group III truncated hemoglobin [Qipengyuania zhejiangensis]|nr:group III truncated hemoglobin [Qipengyuania sp. Z2]
MGIDSDFIDGLVERFYGKVRDDELLGPIFAARIANWPDHLARMKAFWRSVLHQSGEFSGNPMLKHIAIPGIESAEFEHWLALFDQTLLEIERDEAASNLIGSRARMIADSLLTGIRIHRDGRRDIKAMKGLTDA